MSSKRATLVTINSLSSLCKVRSSCNSLNSIQTLALVKCLSTATERFDFQNTNGLNGETCIENQQNPSKFYSYDQNNVEFQQESITHGRNREFQQNPDGFYNKNSVGVGQNPRIDFGQNPVGQNGNLEVVQNPRIDFWQNSIGKNGNFSNGYHKESPTNEYQQTSRTLQQSSNELYGEKVNVQNHYVENRDGVVEARCHPTGFNAQSILEFQGNLNGRYGETTGQDSSAYYPQNTGVSQENLGNNYMGNHGMSQQSTYNYYTGNSRHLPGINYGGNGNSQHVPGNNYGGNSQHVQGKDYVGNGNSQHVPDNNYVGNAGMYQQRPSRYHGENVESPNGGYSREKVSQYQSNPSGNYHASVGHNQQVSSYESRNAMVGPQISSNSTPEGESVEDLQSSPLIGTIEEFDDFCKEGKLKEAVEVLGLLEQQRIPINMPRYFMLMNACGEAKALQEAKSVHEQLMRSTPHLEVSSYNKILEMYSKCGSMTDAYRVFQKMPQRNLTTWDTMITWHAKNGLGEDAMELFTQFKESGLIPDGQMFFGIFSACSALGDIDEGLLHFESMSKNYGISTSMEHYVSIVDMLGSTGYLDEALEFIEKMPMEPSVDVWETLMNRCRVHGNMELGDRCAELVEILDSSRLDEQSKAGLIPVKASDLAKERETKKLAGQNLLEIRSRVHEYRAGDTSHPDNDKIYALLRGMKQQMKEAGYVPETKFVLHDIDQEGKEEALLAHSERLAVAQGLLSSPARRSIRIIKNLRVCGDCHNALKIISKLVGRELIIRDAKRFHHFKDGLCSCRDYW